MIMIGLSENRVKHSLAVARKMQELASKSENFPHSPEDMFLLGYVHDMAYEFVGHQDEHEHYCGELLRDNGYKFWKEVFYHGDPAASYKSSALSLLNYADMTTDPNGNSVTMEMRLEDIGLRYGKTSKQYIKALNLVQLLKDQCLDFV